MKKKKKKGLTSKQRKRLKKSQFALPAKRAYPIPDISHARNALARGSQYASPKERAKIMAAVHKKFPQIKIGGY